MNNIPTAEEFLNQRVYITQDDIEDVHDSVSAVTEAIIDFTKLHVEAALKAASDKALMEEDWRWDGENENHVYTGIDKDSIINAYPLTNIK